MSVLPNNNIPSIFNAGNKPCRSRFGVIAIPFHHGSHKPELNSFPGGGASYKQPPSSAICTNFNIARSRSVSICTVCSRYWQPYKEN